MHQVGAFFVTRAKRNVNARWVYSSATDHTTGMIADQTIAMIDLYSLPNMDSRLRRNDASGQ